MPKVNNYILFPLLLLSLSLLQQAQALKQCSSKTATFFDGQIEPTMSFAYFDWGQNSYIQIYNPFQDSSPLNSITVAFWGRLKAITTPSASEDGTFLDCMDSGQVKYNVNGTVNFTLASNMTSKGVNATISNKYSSASMYYWQAFAFSFSAGSQYMFMNGSQVNK